MELSGSARICISIFFLSFGLTLCNAKKVTEIDWDRCFDPSRARATAETTCLIKKTCDSSNGEFDFVKFDKKKGNLKDQKCGMGIQIKPYTKSKWLVFIQVEKPNVSGLQELDPSKEVMIYKEDKKIFGCKKEGEGVVYDGDEEIIRKKYPFAEEEMSADRIFCAFTVEHIQKDLKEHIAMIGGEEGIKSMLQFEYKNMVGEKPKINLQNMWDSVQKVITCNPDVASFNKDHKDSELMMHEVAITSDDRNDCTGTGGEFLYLKLTDVKGNYTRIDNIYCKFDSSAQPGSRYSYAYKTVDQQDVSIAKTSKFNIFCGTKACSQCGDLPNSPNGTAVTPTGSGQDTCREVKCENDQWEYEHKNGNKGFTVANITCKKFSDKAAWIMKFEGQDVEVAKAGCTKNIDCFSTSPLLGCPENVTTKCEAVKVSKENSNPFSCPIGTLTIVKRGLTEIETTKGPIECNYETGNWKTDFVSGKKNQEIMAGSNMYCNETLTDNQQGEPGPSKGQMAWYFSGAALLAIILIIAGVIGGMKIRRHRKYSPSEREMRKRPKGKGIHRVFPEKLCVDDLAQVKDWPDALFDQILAQWLKFSVYERSKFAERIGFELGVTSSCQHYFKLFTRIFEVEVDYRVWQNVVPTFKLLHAQSADKENNLDTDKRMRKWCIAQCKPILERVGWEGCNNEWRDTAYVRYQVFNLLYYCEDKDFTEKLLEFFDKGQFHGLHSLNRQIAWAAAVRDKDQFEGARKCAEDAVVDKNAKREIAERRAKAASSGGWTKTKTMSEASGASGKSSKSNKGGASGKDKKAAGSKEAKSSASKEGSKSNNSNRSNKSNKSGKDKKGSKETASGKGKKGDSKEASKSGKSGRSGKDKKEKGGSKEAGKGKSKEKPREKAGGEGDSGNEKKEPPSSDNEKKKDKSGKDKKDSSKEKKTTSGKDKKTTSGKDKKTTSGKEKKSSKDKKSSKENKSGKDKKSEKTCPSTKSGKSSKEKKSSKSSKEPKTMTAIDKSSKSAKSAKSKKTTASVKRRRNAAIGMKERRDADGGKLHGDRAQHIFFAIGSSRSKEQIAAFLDWYIECKEYDPSNLVYLFAATLEWDDTRCYGLDLFVNMNKKAFIKMPPGEKHHMRIMKNFRKYVIGELDLQKIQDHLVRDPNYSAKHFGQINSELMLKRIHNNVTFQSRMIDDLDEALKKLNF